jgi:uncharacterized membrane protein
MFPRIGVVVTMREIHLIAVDIRPGLSNVGRQMATKSSKAKAALYLDMLSGLSRLRWLLYLLTSIRLLFVCMLMNVALTVFFCFFFIFYFSPARSLVRFLLQQRHSIRQAAITTTMDSRRRLRIVFLDQLATYIRTEV